MLNKQQKEAAETSSNQALVLAGAGSGKTRVLIERIAYLIEEKQVSPYEIMAFTFTRKAAGEIRDRLHERIGNKAYKCTLGTMHGLALSLIRRFGEFVTVNPHNLTVYSEWESTFLLREVAIDMGIYKKKKWSPAKKHIDAMLNTYYNEGVEPLAGDPLYGIFKAFMFRCKENNALTYGSLLIGFSALLDAGVKQYIHTRHLLVDEVQDINVLQWTIIGKIKDECPADLFIVGDIDQSIYEWRGAVPQYLVGLGPDFDIYRIETNYRSDANIVNAANRLISYNQDRLEKTMVPFEDAQSEIVQVDNVDSAGLVALIESLGETAPDAKRAVLGRVHGILQKLSRLLEEEGVEHTYIGKKTALTNSEDFRRFHAFFKLIVNPFDNFSFLLVHNLLGVPRETYGKIRVKAAQEHKSHFQVWNETTTEGIGHDAFKALGMTETGEAPFAMTVGYLEEAVKIEGRDISNIFQPAADFITEWIKDNSNGDIREYLEWLATYDIQDEMKEEQPLLSLMTIHAAKGLEWPTVIIAGFNEGLLPSKQAIKSGDIESERRLAYVAITRAEDRLILTTRPTSKTSEKTGKVSLEPVSRFIKEMKA